MRRIEHQHNTREQVREYLQTALEVVAELEVTDDLRRPCFEKAVDLIAGKQIVFEQPQVLGMPLDQLRRG